jgi:hypothetical protein
MQDKSREAYDRPDTVESRDKRPLPLQASCNASDSGLPNGFSFGIHVVLACIYALLLSPTPVTTSLHSPNLETSPLDTDTPPEQQEYKLCWMVTRLRGPSKVGW